MRTVRDIALKYFLHGDTSKPISKYIKDAPLIKTGLRVGAPVFYNEAGQFVYEDRTRVLCDE